jgi:hypothetical protein
MIYFDLVFIVLPFRILKILSLTTKGGREPAPPIEADST